LRSSFNISIKYVTGLYDVTGSIQLSNFNDGSCSFVDSSDDEDANDEPDGLPSSVEQGIRIQEDLKEEDFLLEFEVLERNLYELVSSAALHGN
jgi:hypothetical protein